MRQEPFTTLAVNLQGGRFDCPDRVFFEFKSTWDGCNKSMSDVKELIVSVLPFTVVMNLGVLRTAQNYRDCLASIHLHIRIVAASVTHLLFSLRCSAAQKR